MADATVLAAVYLLHKCRKRQRNTRRRVWVHDILRRRGEYGEFHHLLQELRTDDSRFRRHFRMSVSQFDELLALLDGGLTHVDTNWRRSITAAERLSICLR